VTDDTNAFLLPERLRPGDVIGVVTPSGAGPAGAPRRFSRGVCALSELGFDVRVGPQASAVGHTAGPASARTAELNDFLRDRDVRAVIASIGGYTANALLNTLDYEALRRDPKIVVGYSDLTVLLSACLMRAGVVVFHGPTLMPELGEYPAPLRYTVETFLRAVSDPRPLGRLKPAPAWTDEFLEWDRDDVRPRAMRHDRPWTWLASGTGTGGLFGGNLESMCVLGGTAYLPRVPGGVLVWETTSTNLGSVDRALTHLEMLGIFDGLAGMIVGRTHRAPADFEDQLNEHLLARFREREVPIVTQVDLGHTDPMLTLPLGVRARLDSAARTVEILDAAVR
jgi:muramoyltetrapeptide carboxypeptidase LdcA involved in peptidoglycan recycling